MATSQIHLDRAVTFVPELMNRLDTLAAPSTTAWLWHGLIARRNITLFTSQWKAGKTTLIAGLLQQFATGGTFLDRPVLPAKILVVSEESRTTWADRVRRMPIGEHCRLLARPFSRRPTPSDCDRLIELAREMQAAGQLDLLVIDPLARFLPGNTDCDLNALQQMLDPLQSLSDGGAGVIILHHPRKKRSEEGNTSRGHGGLLAAVDIIVELSSFGQLRSDQRRRKLFALSRFPETPRRLVYEWEPSGCFKFLGDPLAARFNENWETLHAILAQRKKAATHQELLMDWPADQEKPSAVTLYEWLNRAHDQKRLRRQGNSRKADPYRYRLENEDDQYYDRGELPPLRDLPPLFGRR
jgi:AAA domain